MILEWISTQFLSLFNDLKMDLHAIVEIRVHRQRDPSPGTVAELAEGRWIIAATTDDPWVGLFTGIIQFEETWGGISPTDFSSFGNNRRPLGWPVHGNHPI